MANTAQPLSSPEPRPGKDFSELEKLYRMYGIYAFRVAKQYTADDQIAEEIVHEAYLKYWNDKESSLQTLSSVSFFGWLIREVQKNCKERILEFKPLMDQRVLSSCFLGQAS